MKRKLAFILSIALLITAFIPFQASAETDQGFRQALTVAKETFDIGANYTLVGYNSYTDNGRISWSLNWTDKKDPNNSYINVTVNDKGVITQFDKSRAYVYSQKKKLPKLSRQDAVVKADAFIKKVNPGVFGQLMLNDPNDTTLNDYDYSIYYTRIQDSIPYYNNSVSVTVDRDTGEVYSYSYNWTDDLVFPAKDKAITLEQAVAAYKEKLGLKLNYQLTYSGEKPSVFAAYVPAFNDDYVIDALTGEKIRTGYNYGYPIYATNEMSKKMADSGAGSVTLTPEELEAIEQVSSLISEDEAEKLARGLSELDLTDDFKLNSGNLYRGWDNQKDFYWYLDFSKDVTGDSKDYGWASVQINAKTKEIRSFNRDRYHEEGATAKFDKTQAQKAVEDLVKKIASDKFTNVVYDPDSTNTTEKNPTWFNFSYTRMVNGVPFPANNISVGFDAITGKIQSYSSTWYDMEFPAIGKDVTPDKSFDTLFGTVGYELQYRIKYVENADSQTKPEMVLVYAVKPNKPLLFDPTAGTLLDYDGKPYEEVKPAVYTDIKGNIAEMQINVLAQFGISLPGTEFKPDDKIAQKDFLLLLSKTISDYYVPIYYKEDDSKAVDDMYSQLIRSGVVKEGEKAPDSTITKEEAVKFMIRALKYDKVGDIKGIYKTTFKDEDKISTDLVGYVAIAQGLKIVSGNKGIFNPKAVVTRAQAAIMIYNYLQI